MNKTTKLILAIVSAVLSVAIIVGVVLFVLASCNDDGTVKKRKKKVVIVKKPNTTQNDDTSEEDDDPYDTDFESEDESEDEYDDDDADSESDEEEPEEEPYPYEVYLNGKGGLATANPLNQRIGMSFYHFYQGDWDASLSEIYGVTEAEFMNYYRVSGITDLKALEEKKGLGWMLVGNPFPDRDTLTFRDGWEESMITNAEAYKVAGVWDQLAGFETEEICMAVTQEQYKKLTRFLRDNFPDKRIFSCLSMYEVRGTAPAGFTIAPMSYDTYGYITDIGYDWYSHLNVDQYRDAVKQMLGNMERENNVRVWFFPTNYGFGNVDEQFCIDHTNIMYDMLMDKTLVKNPGGLYCYTWKSFGEPGMQELIDPERSYKWTRLGNEIIRIGKEILASDYRYDYSVLN